MLHLIISPTSYFSDFFNLTVILSNYQFITVKFVTQKLRPRSICSDFLTSSTYDHSKFNTSEFSSLNCHGPSAKTAAIHEVNLFP